MIPNISLAVDGSARTLSWVEVIPSTGVSAGRGGGGNGVSDRAADRVDVGSKVAVMIRNVGVAASISLTFIPQPAQNKARMMNNTFRDTGKL
jgi:hypothetical protein